MNLRPDDPGAICPCCRQPWPDEDGDLEKLIRRNIGRVSLHVIASAASVSVEKVARIAARISNSRRA